MGVTKAKGRTALFQEGFAISGKEFRSRQSVGRWAGAARLRSRAATFRAASLRAGGPCSFHTAGAELKPVGLAWRVFLLALAGAATC
jgi:hypothetical protein